MSLFAGKAVLHHFKICFPLPLEKVQNCLKKIQNIKRTSSAAVCVSFTGFTQSPENCQLLYDSLINAQKLNQLPVYTFLEDKATSLTYYTATAGMKINANPYSLIGDIGTAQKSYRNIKKLLDILGIKYEQLGSRDDSSRIWNQFVEKSAREKQITHKWIQLIENTMINSASERRNISKDVLGSIRNKVFHPKEAVTLNLIDSVSTFEQFSDRNFPNVKISDFVYKIDGIRVQPTQREISALSNFFQLLQMPQVALLSSTNPLQDCLKEVMELVEARLMSENGVNEFEQLLGQMFANLSGLREESNGLMFEL